MLAGVKPALQRAGRNLSRLSGCHRVTCTFAAVAEVTAMCAVKRLILYRLNSPRLAVYHCLASRHRMGKIWSARKDSNPHRAD